MPMVEVESARHAWEEGHRRFQETARDRLRGARLHAQLEVVTDELRKRVGQTFTLGDLARTYERADDWARDAIGEHAASPGWPSTATLVSDAAFYLYQRGAQDYAP